MNKWKKKIKTISSRTYICCDCKYPDHCLLTLIGDDSNERPISCPYGDELANKPHWKLYSKKQKVII